jgi:hypothetical protein
MCRSLISVGWDGRLFDCDFNQMLEIEAPGTARTIWDVDDLSQLEGQAIAWVLSGHPEDQLLDLGRGPRATRPAGLAAVVLLRDEPSVPSEQRVRGHQRANLEEPSATDLLGLGRKSAALSVREP